MFSSITPRGVTLRSVIANVCLVKRDNPFPSVSSVQSVQFIPFLSLSIRIIRPIRTAYSPSACCRRRSLMAVVAASAAAKSNNIHGSPMGDSLDCPDSAPWSNPLRIDLLNVSLASSSSASSSGDASPARNGEVEVIIRYL